MPRRIRRIRAAIATAAVAGLVATLPPVTSGTAQASAEVFAPQLVTVDTPTRAHKELLQTLGLDLTEHAGRGYVEVVLHTLADVEALRGAGLTYDVRIANLVAREAQINRINEAFAAATVRSALPSGRDTYRVLDDYNTEMAALAEQRPNIAKVFELPHKSLDGRSVHGIEIGARVQGTEDGRPVFVLLGLHHAREWPSGELAMEFAVDLVKSYGKNERITDLLRRSRVIVVPVVNVDGFHMSRTDGGNIDLREIDSGGTVSLLATPGNAYKRKNCRIIDGQDTPDGSCALAATSPGGFGVGVDLNRNYGGFWGGPGASGPAPDADGNTGLMDPTYRGAAPFSEPETQNIRELVSARQVTMLISNHTFSNLVLRPNGVHPDTIGFDGHPVGNAPDEQALKELGARMTAQNGYANIHGWELYDTTGTTEDWSYNATGGFGYTFEIGPNEFHPPFPQVIDEYLGAGDFKGKGNREAFLIALENAVDRDTHSVITGKAPRGAVLRLTKTFESPTWESSFTDSLNTTMKVKQRNGQYVWHVNPSTRPIVMDKRIEVTEDASVASKTFEGGPTTIGQEVDHEFVVERSDLDLLKINLDWPTPDDFDLEVYRRDGDRLVQVGTSGNVPSQKEEVEIATPLAGTYVLRVINFASASPTYTLKAELFESKLISSEVIPGLVEKWTLTCERKGGAVLETVQVAVDRGQQVKVNLTRCLSRW